MIPKEKLIAMFAAYDFPTTDFGEWDRTSKNIITDEYFNALAVVERSEMQLEAMEICEDFNPFIQPELLIEALQTTIRNMLYNQVAEVLRCSGLVSY